uniref:Putative ovule protein n=1 Tax=Solanum chacoense TaxID=4108 RepID=A0A0V0H9K9_SOLCH
MAIQKVDLDGLKGTKPIQKSLSHNIQVSIAIVTTLNLLHAASTTEIMEQVLFQESSPRFGFEGIILNYCRHLLCLKKDQSRCSHNPI